MNESVKRLDDEWIKVLQNSSLDPCPQAAEEILELRKLLIEAKAFIGSLPSFDYNTGTDRFFDFLRIIHKIEKQLYGKILEEQDSPYIAGYLTELYDRGEKPIEGYPQKGLPLTSD